MGGNGLTAIFLLVCVAFVECSPLLHEHRVKRKVQYLETNFNIGDYHVQSDFHGNQASAREADLRLGESSVHEDQEQLYFLGTYVGK